MPVHTALVPAVIPVIAASPQHFKTLKLLITEEVSFYIFQVEISTAVLRVIIYIRDNKNIYDTFLFIYTNLQLTTYPRLKVSSWK